MIKNILGLALLVAVDLGGTCASEVEPHSEAWQGVVELEVRDLAFEVPGRIEAIAVAEGDWVEAGDPLARLETAMQTRAVEAREAEVAAADAELALLQAGSRPADIRSMRAELQAARVRERHAERTLQRQRDLARQGVASSAELDDAEAAYEQAMARRQELRARLARLRHGARAEEITAARARREAARAALASARIRLDQHLLRAEAAGQISNVHLEPHELATVGSPAVTVADPRMPYVDVFVPQSEIDAVTVGAPMRIEVDSHSHALTGHVEHIAREAEFTPKFLFSPRERPNLVLRVRIRIEDPDARLHAGIPAFVTPKDGPPEQEAS